MRQDRPLLSPENKIRLLGNWLSLLGKLILFFFSPVLIIDRQTFASGNWLLGKNSRYHGSLPSSWQMILVRIVSLFENPLLSFSSYTSHCKEEPYVAFYFASTKCFTTSSLHKRWKTGFEKSSDIVVDRGFLKVNRSALSCLQISSLMLAPCRNRFCFRLADPSRQFYCGAKGIGERMGAVTTFNHLTSELLTSGRIHLRQDASEKASRVLDACIQISKG